MAVGTDTSKKQLNAPELFYFLFIGRTYGFEIIGGTVENVGIFFLNVYVAEKVVPHE